MNRIYYTKLQIVLHKKQSYYNLTTLQNVPFLHAIVTTHTIVGVNLTQS